MDKRSLPVLVFITITAACAVRSHVREVSVSPGFSWDMVARDGIAVVGFTARTAGHIGDSRVAPFTPSRLSIELTEVLEGAQKNWRLADVDETVSSLGEGSYHRLVQAFDRRGELQEQDVRELSEVLRQRARFFLLGRVVDDRNAYDSTYGSSRCDDRHEKLYTTTRTLAVELKVYDGWRGLPSWSAVLDHEEKRWACSNPTSAGSLIFGVLAAVVGREREPGEELEHPQPPDLTFMLASFFKGFAEQVTSLAKTVPPRESTRPTVKLPQ